MPPVLRCAALRVTPDLRSQQFIGLSGPADALGPPGPELCLWQWQLGLDSCLPACLPGWPGLSETLSQACIRIFIVFLFWLLLVCCSGEAWA